MGEGNEVRTSKAIVGIKTVILFILFVAIFAALGALIAFVIGLFTDQVKWYHGTLVMSVLAVLAIVIGIISTKWHVHKMRKLAASQQGSYRSLESIAGQLSEKAGIRRPSVIVDSYTDEPNAYTLGSRKSSYIVVNAPLLDILSYDEIEGILAHEVSHIKDNDCFTTILTTRLSNVTAAFSKHLGLGLINAGKKLIGIGSAARLHRGGLLVFVLLAIISVIPMAAGCVLCLFYPPAAVLKMGISREREYVADRSAAYLTLNPRGLADALQKLQDYSVPDAELDDRYADSCIVSHFSRETIVNRLMNTHPPTEKRIRRLLEIEKEMVSKGIIRR